MVTSSLTTSATLRSRTVRAAVSTAVRAAASHESVLVPMTSVTRYTLSVMSVLPVAAGGPRRQLENTPVKVTAVHVAPPVATHEHALWTVWGLSRIVHSAPRLMRAARPPLARAVLQSARVACPAHRAPPRYPGPTVCPTSAPGPECPASGKAHSA